MVTSQSRGLATSASELQKVLELERRRNYDDTATTNGLAHHLAAWVTRSRGRTRDEAEDAAVLALFESLQHYTELDHEERAQRVTEALRAVATWGKHEPERSSTGATTFEEARDSFAEHLRTSAKVTALPLLQPAAGGLAPGPVSPPKKAVPRPAVSLTPSARVTALGIRAETAAKFARLGLNTLEDLLYCFPRRYDDFRKIRTVAQIVIGEPQSVHVRVQSSAMRMIGGKMRSTEIWASDGTGRVKAVWFNQPWLVREMPVGTPLILSGTPSFFKGVTQFEGPEFEVDRGQELVHTGRLAPVYPLTEGLAGRMLRARIKGTIDACLERLEDPLPAAIRESAGLWPLQRAVRALHFPEDEHEAEEAQRRLAFDHLFAMQIKVLQRRRAWEGGLSAEALDLKPEALAAFHARLPFALTADQQTVLNAILEDLRQSRPMARLLQGDVGSGKTVVAASAMLVAHENGFQSAIMAPTEILAEQHFKSLSRMFEAPDPVYALEGQRPPAGAGTLRVALLTGSTPAKEKRAIKEQLKSGAIHIIVGTHALLVENVDFQRLGLVVVDEQHRFGVNQRLTLRQKSHNPHLLVMTATPIPRTLNLTLNGDLDLSEIRELPPGRRPVETFFVRPHQRARAYERVRKEVQEGRQAFIVCPLIDESEEIEAKAATTEHTRLTQEVFPELELKLLHGRMKAKEKDATMREFRDRAFDVLVSTTVIEVGIDIPNATVMLIEGADRFGLAQLHQLRGRVGRGEHKSYCLLLSDSDAPETEARLKMVAETTNGFDLAEEDLRRRGPGEFLGTRQSGHLAFQMARLADLQIVESTRAEAVRLFLIDPSLEKPEHAALRARLERVWPDSAGDIS